MKRLLWLLRHHAARLALVSGGMLVAAALAQHWLVVRPLEQRVEALQAQAPAAPEGAVQGLNDALLGPRSARQRLDGFYRHVQEDGRLTERLARVHAVARKLGLQLKRADYRLDSQPGRRLDRYQMTVPIEGTYPAIRAFVSAVLRELPTVSLEQIQYQRPDVTEGLVDAQVSFVFHIVK